MKHTKWLLLVILPVIVLAAAAFVLLGRSPAARAEEALQQLLSCSVEEAETLEQALSVPAVTDGSAGLLPVDDSSLTEYLTERYGGCMTEDCLAQQTANRSVSRSARLAKAHGSDIRLSGLSLAKSSGSGNVYTFTGVLTTDGKTVETISGTIQMEKTDAGWKASEITLN